MLSSRFLVSACLLTALVATGCNSGAVATAVPSESPTAQPSASPSTAPTTAPTTEPSVAATTSASAELVLSLDDISVEDLGHHADRWRLVRRSNRPDDRYGHAGDPVVLREERCRHEHRARRWRHDRSDHALRSEPVRVRRGDVRPGPGQRGPAQRDPRDRIRHVLHRRRRIDRSPRESILESATYGPDVVTMRIGADADSPDDGFIYFERAR